MKVIIIPLGKENPYQYLLKQNLEKLGLEVKVSGVRVILSLINAIKKHGKPDIMNIHWHHPFFLATNWPKTIIKSASVIIELILLKLLGIKIVWTVHNIKNHENRYIKTELFFTSIMARLCDAIIAHCNAAKTKVQKAFCLKKDNKIHIIHHGNYINYYKNTISKEKARSELGYSKGNLIFLFFGQIRPYKGTLEMIESFRELNDDNVRLLIVGKPYGENMDSLIEAKAGEINSLKYIPEFVDDNEIQNYMNACDAVLFPYRDILTSGGILLAMSFGKAIIAPAIGCIPEYLDKNGSLLYDPSEKDGLLKVMEKALSFNLEEMGRNNMKLAENYGWGQISIKTYEVFKKHVSIKN